MLYSATIRMLFGNLLNINHQTDNRRNKRQRIRYRHTDPDTFQSPPVREKQQARQKIKQLTRQRKENTYFALPILWKKLPITICAPTNGNINTVSRIPPTAKSINSSLSVKRADTA